MFKLPKLVSHYKQHHELNNEVGILDFIEMHYLGRDINDNDEEDDMQLPFKKVTAAGHLSHAIPTGRLVLLTQHFFRIDAVAGSNYTDVLVNPALGSLFRPPRG